MRRNWTPSIAPKGDDQTVYVVDFGRGGRACRETGVETIDLQTAIDDNVLGDPYNNSIRVVAFNTAEGRRTSRRILSKSCGTAPICK